MTIIVWLHGHTSVIQEIRSASKRPAPRALLAPGLKFWTAPDLLLVSPSEAIPSIIDHCGVQYDVVNSYVCPLVMGYFGNYRMFCKLPLLSTADLGAGIRKGQQLNVDHMKYLQVWYQKKNNTIMGECKYIHFFIFLFFISS